MTAGSFILFLAPRLALKMKRPASRADGSSGKEKSGGYFFFFFVAFFLAFFLAAMMFEHPLPDVISIGVYFATLTFCSAIAAVTAEPGVRELAVPRCVRARQSTRFRSTSALRSAFPLIQG
jgi:hypothetical protein